ncbi:hypothetical protein Zmor_004402, partial [Zophobas morio]
ISTFGKFKFSEPITSIASKDKETILILLKSGKVFKLYLENSNGKKEYSQLSTSEDSGTRIYLDICCELCKYKEKNGLEKNIFTQVYFKQLHFALSSTLTYLPPPCITKIRCGLLHGVCLDDQGRLWSFGANNFGQLGRGLPINTEFEEEPKIIKALDGLQVVDVDCGYWHVVAVTSFGDIYTWGWNNFSQLGRLTAELESTCHLPHFIESDVEACKVSCGSSHSVVIDEKGHLYGWGWSKYGQLGKLSGEPGVNFPQRIECSGLERNKAINVFCGPWSTLVQLY